MEKVLAVIASWDDADQVLARARHLAERLHTHCEFLRPVHAQVRELQHYMDAAAFGEIQEQILEIERARLDALRGDDPGEVVWCQRVYRAVVEHAELIGADLILMSASRQGALANLIHRADDWHLLREAPCPVLLLPRVPKPIQRVIAAVDALSEGTEQELLSERVLDAAAAFAHAHAVPLTVITVVPDPALIYASPVAVPMGEQILDELTERARFAQQALLARIGLHADAVRVESGRVEDVVTELAADGLLVIGSAANKGLKGMVMGNTAERILHRMTTEMLVVN
ncbi:MAG: universal stress protein [Gammaproteobacteria bacterium]|nr:universal stress protein [Gammaproteobacteria bacterium]